MKRISARFWLLSALCLASFSCTPAPAQKSHLQFSIASDALLPHSDGKLHYRAVSKANIDAQIKAYGNRTVVLNETIRLAPNYFPKGSRVLSVRQGVVDLNASFGNQNFWLKRNPRATRLALYAFVNTIAPMNEPKGGTVPVRFTIEGKPVSRIGKLDTSRPLKINMKLVAKRGFAQKY